MSIAEIDHLAYWRNTLQEWVVPGSPSQTGEADNVDGWSWLADRFRAMNRAFQPDRDPFFNKLIPWLGRDVSVLDIGAATGRLTLPLAERAQKVIAVEASPGMQRALREEVAARGLANVEVVAGAWPAVEVDPVDLAFCSHVLYDVAEVGPFLSQMDAVARRACFVYLTVTHPLATFRDLWEIFWHWSPPTQPTYLDAAQCLYQLGLLANIEVVSAPQDISFSTFEEGLAFVSRRLGLTSAADEAKLKDYLAAHGQWEAGRWYPPPQSRRTAILWWSKLD